MKAGIRYLFNSYARICLSIGGVLLGLLGLLWLFKWLLDWQTPLNAGDWFSFATGFIIVAISLGPYAATVGQLTKVQRAANVRVQTGQPLSKGRRQLWMLVGAILGLVFLVGLIISRSLILWLTFGSLFCLMGLVLLYIAWQIGRIERAANMVIYAQDYTWRFDRQSYFGVLNGASELKNKPLR